jgi:hypothetical protein
MQKISEAMAGPIWRAFMLQALPKLKEPMINLPVENSTSTAATTTAGAATTAPAAVIAPVHLYNTTTGELIY